MAKRLLEADHSGPRPDGTRPILKKRKIVHHKLLHTQPYDIPDQIDGAGPGPGFFTQQLHRAIGIEMRGVGFSGATPDAMQAVASRVEEYMLHFLGNVRTAMNASRRTAPVPHDFIHALKKAKLKPSDLQHCLDRGDVPPSLLQPQIPAPSPQEQPPPNVEALLGPALSGAAEKASKKYIPSHLPSFPSKHTWQATPVYTQRETDPRKIREKATAEGIMAEQSLRKLQAAHKAGIQKQGATKKRMPKQRKKIEDLFEEAIKDIQKNEAEREQTRMNKEQEQHDGQFDFGLDSPPRQRKPVKKKPEQQVDGTMCVNYDRKFWRVTARDGVSGM
ncbi:hypothetical protein GQ43DRAFT_369212 [Delitschia confertaspora ATCC 74209]|uniref:Transcription initiation factor TFIID subunit 8 n=1 Tax=Delitschia confertaspora ATCC 74209 TaxID=1513339 RepID=A0A9P4MWP6_9PLEO|nr:hypothetical protein GQ43DRAFT_369212 [Delitschia confertaspora ATCC 74209]